MNDPYAHRSSNKSTRRSGSKHFKAHHSAFENPRNSYRNPNNSNNLSKMNISHISTNVAPASGKATNTCSPGAQVADP